MFPVLDVACLGALKLQPAHQECKRYECGFFLAKDDGYTDSEVRAESKGRKKVGGGGGGGGGGRTRDVTQLRKRATPSRTVHKHPTGLFTA